MVGVGERLGFSGATVRRTLVRNVDGLPLGGINEHRSGGGGCGGGDVAECLGWVTPWGTRSQLD